MNQIQAIFKCKVCEKEMMLSFRRPSLIRASIFNDYCGNCYTDYDFKIKILKGTHGHDLDVESKYKKPAIKTQDESPREN